MILGADILKQIDTLPTLPVSASRLMALAGQEQATISQFEDVIRPDPAISTNLLRVANSAYIGMPDDVISVRRALVVLGVERTAEIAASEAFKQMVPDRIQGYELDAGAFWQHCIAVAVLSEQVARQLGWVIPDLTFTVGLLHDVGKLAIGTFLAREASDIRRRIHSDGLDLVTAERLVLGFDHAQAGAALVEHWGLPDALVAPIRYHHDLGQLDPGAPALAIAELVHVADGLAHSLGFGADIAEMSRTMDPEACERLGLDAAQLETVILESMDGVLELSDLIGLPRGEVSYS